MIDMMDAVAEFLETRNKDVIHKAITDYLASGQADQLILDHVYKSQPRCDRCKHLDAQTMTCWITGDTMQAFQHCNVFKPRKEET